MLSRADHQVLVQCGAGIGSGFSDDQYTAAGSVFVDIAIDQGGCAETSRVTTHSDPVYIEEGVVHYCVGNMPGAYARTATQALTNVTLPYALQLASLGLKNALAQSPELRVGINTMDGKLVCAAVAEAHRLPHTPLDAH
jgi:alanine dehydrogenase